MRKFKFLGRKVLKLVFSGKGLLLKRVNDHSRELSKGTHFFAIALNHS